MKDYYAILGVHKTASADEVKSAYQRLAKKFHPDVNPDSQEWAAEMFKPIGEAFAVLGDPVKRRAYDVQRRLQPMPEQATARDPLAAGIDFLVRAASPYVPPEQMTELLQRALIDYGVPAKNPSLVDLAERIGFLKRKKPGVRRAS
jgi:curved DNA-binding protein CbpA